MRLGDLAESVAAKLITDSSAPIQEATAITEEAALQDENSLYTKIRFSWKAEDKAILERIRIAADDMFQEAFADTIAVIDDFYMQLRVPEVREVGGHEVVLLGADGRPVWKKNDQGQVIEDWNQLTGQDVEYTLANITRLRLSLASRVNELFLEALYARHVASDVYDDTWGTMMDATQGDRAAKSNRSSRTERYGAYFRFYLYSMADTFLKEITAFGKLLENIRYWQVRTQKG